MGQYCFYRIIAGEILYLYANGGLEMKRKLCVIAALLTLCAAVSSCSGGSAPAQTPVETNAPVTTTTTENTVSESETSAPEGTDENTSEVTETDEHTEIDDKATPKANTVEDTTPDSEETVSEVEEETTSAAVKETTTEQTTASAETTAAATTTTTAAATAAAPETTTTAAPPKKADPSPPQINPVSSPGKNVFTADSAVLDYSNCTSGYISVDYKGKTRLKMLLKKDSGQFDYDIYPAKGPQYFTLAQGSGTYTAELYEMLDNGKFVKLFGEQFKAKIADEVNMFTYTNQFVSFGSSSACVAKASEVCAGCTTNIEKIAAVFGYVTDNITYDKALAASVTSGYIPDPDKVLSKKKGICFDYASLVAAMLRSQGVPTRLVIGYASPNIYHAWNEVYTPEKGWIAAEIVLDGKGFKRIDATFYASASNKQTFADYIAKSGNYSDVYVY